VTQFKTQTPYHICVIDIGSPKLGNLGWCLIDIERKIERTGSDLDALFPLMSEMVKHRGLILGLEAPLFVPLRKDLMLATKGRKGEGRKPWSAGAGAQVLVMNLPIMIYILQSLKAIAPQISYHLHEQAFTALPQNVMIFEAFVSGTDKGHSHIDDAQIMARSCAHFSERQRLPNSILEHEDGTTFFNLTAAALLRCGLEFDTQLLHTHSPIYKPEIFV
jgi:hypothetical protein